jgi:molybdenum cofactor cytidylyltransferase
VISGIVLAAGASTRMGAFKQLLPLGDRVVIQVVVARIARKVERTFAVLGHRAEEVQRALRDYPVECVYNPDYSAGMLSSVKCGIRAAARADAYLICLGDQPGISPGAVDAVLAGAACRKGIVIPCHGGRRGHPILIRRSYREEILALPPDQGLNRVTRRYPEDTLEVSVDDAQILSDMDTPADYAREKRRFLENSRRQAGNGG